MYWSLKGFWSVLAVFCSWSWSQKNSVQSFFSLWSLCPGIRPRTPVPSVFFSRGRSLVSWFSEPSCCFLNWCVTGLWLFFRTCALRVRYCAWLFFCFFPFGFSTVNACSQAVSDNPSIQTFVGCFFLGTCSKRSCKTLRTYPSYVSYQQYFLSFSKTQNIRPLVITYCEVLS